MLPNILKVFCGCLFLAGTVQFQACAQLRMGRQQGFTRADTLRGSLRPERNCYDVTYYHLNIRIDPERRHIGGYNDIRFRVAENFSRIQVDLFGNMRVDKIVWEGQELAYTREHDAVFVDFPREIKKGGLETIRFFYSGQPVEAKNAPWDGGFVWAESGGKPWIGVACQGTGASLWWPNKDHQSEEPDSMLISVAVPDGLINVSNGQSRGKKSLGDGYTRWDWFVGNPINNYDVTVNIAPYAHFSADYKGHTLDYYVLPENVEKAKHQFGEVIPMMECFEERFGPYPFWEDGFKLVETPYLGMEHQSAVAYGNGYEMGYRGRDLSGTGLGLKWDFIIIHETAHEWFGNSLTTADIADMWVHEGFTTWAESVYHECRWGYDEAMDYLNGLKGNVLNREPVTGPYGVNKEGSGDMYPKGALLVNTLRHIVNDDEKWWAMIREFCSRFRHQVLTGSDVIEFFCEASGRDLRPVFRQYLQHPDLPELELDAQPGVLRYRWNADVREFNMPVDMFIEGRKQRLEPTREWKEFPIPGRGAEPGDIRVAQKQFYVRVKQL